MKVLQILFLILSLVGVINAQKTILTGTLYDATGAVIPKEKVVAINDKDEKFEAQTNNNGVYSLSRPFNSHDDKKSSADFRIAKFEIFVDLENRGFEKFEVKGFKLVPANSGKMIFDIALDSLTPEPCGYAGADCLPQMVVEMQPVKITDKVLPMPLKKSPKAQIKKRKN